MLRDPPVGHVQLRTRSRYGRPVNAGVAGTMLPGHGYRHEAMAYAGIDEFSPPVIKFIDSGLRAGAAVLVVVNEEKIEILRDSLAGDVHGVTFADMTDVGANPARIIGAWHRFLNDWTRGPVRGVGEPFTPNARRVSWPNANSTNRF
jgi:hypothetical protein